MEIGRISPRDALKRLAPDGSEYHASCRLIQVLDDGDVAALRELSPIRGLLDFLEELRSNSAVVAAGS
jgi:hypothetical protein